MKQYEITISGSGTIEEIKAQLAALLEDLSSATEEDLYDYANEDPTLYTEIYEIEEEI